MKLTVKTLQQKVFQIDADGADTIADIKAKIQETQGHPTATQKLIYAGKVLSDNKTVASCEIKEKDFLVLMVSKPKPTPQEPSSSASASASTPAPSTPPASAPASAPAPASASAIASTPPSQDVPAGTSFLSGAVLQTSIENMVEMGFPRDQVMRALRASFNNPERAVEYLMNGIPAHLEAEPAAGSNQGQQPEPTPALPSSPTPAATQAPAQPAQPSQPQNLFQLAQQRQQQHQRPQGGAGAALNLGGGMPQMDQIRQLMEQNPAHIQQMIQQLVANNPALARLLSENPEEFLRQLGGDGADETEGDPGAPVVHVTPEEHEAIQRLEALGFPRHKVLEAYFVCDRNEERAANYLFEHGDED